MLRQLLRWDYGEKVCDRHTCVVGEGKTKAGSSVGSRIRDWVGNVWSSPGTTRMGLVGINFPDRIRVGLV